MNLHGRGTIYFALDPMSGRVKIGISRNVAARMEDVAKHFAVPLDVLLTVEGSYAAEHFIHKMLREHRIRGEWFRDHLDVRNCIEVLRAMGLAGIGFTDQPLQSRNNQPPTLLRAQQLVRLYVAYSELASPGETVVARLKRLSETIGIKGGSISSLMYRGWNLPDVHADVYANLVQETLRAMETARLTLEADLKFVRQIDAHARGDIDAVPGLKECRARYYQLMAMADDDPAAFRAAFDAMRREEDALLVATGGIARRAAEMAGEEG